MRRWAGMFAGATATAMAIAAFLGCNLDLKPYVDPVDSGIGFVPTDSGNGTGTDAKPSDASVQDDGSTDVDAADAGPRKRVFVTSTTTVGNLGGVVGANAKCQQAATTANLGGTFIAWLSVNNDPVFNRIQNAGPWYLVDRQTLVFANKLVITTVGPNVPIDRDEKGTKIPVNPGLAWTGTQANGQAAAQNCNNFAAPALGQGLAGKPDQKDGQWTQAATTTACGQALHLYCLEQ